MTWRASAPGKLVILGEYAVLDGACALVMAVDRRARAEIGAAVRGPCRLETRMPAPSMHDFERGSPSGVALVDLVTGPAPAAPAWRGLLDTSALYAPGAKLGLGSSSAALVAFAGAWQAFTRPGDASRPGLRVDELIALHRRFQSGGSGLDVASCFTGGVVRFRLEAGRARLGSVRLPNSVGFAGIFAGRSASTPDLVARYRAWSREQPRAAAAFRRRMGGVAEVGCEAADGNDARGLLDAIAEYGRGLEALGRAIGAEIMTAEHGSIAAEARRCGVVYKVSGAGGGDLGLAFSDDSDALARFEAAVTAAGFSVVGLGVDPAGLAVEERTQ